MFYYSGCKSLNPGPNLGFSTKAYLTIVASKCFIAHVHCTALVYKALDTELNCTSVHYFSFHCDALNYILLLYTVLH